MKSLSWITPVPIWPCLDCRLFLFGLQFFPVRYWGAAGWPLCCLIAKYLVLPIRLFQCLHSELCHLFMQEESMAWDVWQGATTKLVSGCHSCRGLTILLQGIRREQQRKTSNILILISKQSLTCDIENCSFNRMPLLSFRNF